MEAYIQEALEHAKGDIDNEICGLVVIHKGQKCFIPCKNVAERPSDNFIIHASDWVKADKQGEIVGVVHSHPRSKPLPSQADLVGCESSRIPWTIVNPRTEEFHVFEPKGYQAPLYGRSYCHGVLDCYSFVRDFYLQEHGIYLNDYPREEFWWRKGFDLYKDHMIAEGFSAINPEQVLPGDAFIMNIESDVGNHAGIYLGDSLMAHHLYGRLSSRDIYGGYYRKHTLFIVRHKDLNQ